MTRTHIHIWGTAIVAICLVWFGCFAHAHAASTLTSDGGRLLLLTAKVEYLKAFVAALTSGERSPAPTFITALNGDIVVVIGTVARDPNATRVETCGTLPKGKIDWGDGVIEPVYGLGCSGDAYTFTAYHRYSTSDSFKVTLADDVGRTAQRTVAVRTLENDSAPTLRTTIDEDAVVVRGHTILDRSTRDNCGDSTQGVVAWGDGTYDALAAGCSDREFSFEHTYALPGVYKLYVHDREGDMTQELVTIK